MKDFGLPSATIKELDILNLESLLIWDDERCDFYEVHFLGKKSERNLCWKYHQRSNLFQATGDYEQQTFAWIEKMVESGRFIILDGDMEEIGNQLYVKDVLTSHKNKWAPRPV